MKRLVFLAVPLFGLLLATTAPAWSHNVQLNSMMPGKAIDPTVAGAPAPGGPFLQDQATNFKHDPRSIADVIDLNFYGPWWNDTANPIWVPCPWGGLNKFTGYDISSVVQIFPPTQTSTGSLGQLTIDSVAFYMEPLHPAKQDYTLAIFSIDGPIDSKNGLTIPATDAFYQSAIAFATIPHDTVNAHLDLVNNQIQKTSVSIGDVPLVIPAGKWFAVAIIPGESSGPSDTFYIPQRYETNLSIIPCGAIISTSNTGTVKDTLRSLFTNGIVWTAGDSRFVQKPWRYEFTIGVTGQFDSTLNSGVGETSQALNTFGLNNYPNPVRTATRFAYTLDIPADVTLDVYDILGRNVSRLVNHLQDAGLHTAVFDAKDLPAGLYSYTLTAGNRHVTNRLLVTK